MRLSDPIKILKSTTHNHLSTFWEGNLFIMVMLYFSFIEWCESVYSIVSAAMSFCRTEQRVYRTHTLRISLSDALLGFISPRT